MESYKYLIRIPNHLGDAIMALPAVKSFLLSNQKGPTVLLMPKWAESIYKNAGNNKVILLPNNRLHGLSAIFYQIGLIRKYKIATGILLTPSFSSALALFFGGIKNRFGYKTDNRGLLLNNCFSIPNDEFTHRADKYKLLLEKAGERKLETRLPQLVISESQKANAIKLLVQNGINKIDQYIVIAPQAIAESRRWGTDNYSRLADRLIENCKVKIVLVGTADQYNAGQKISQNNQKILNFCGKTDIEQAASVLSGALLFIGNDSGLAHLASAVDIPLIVLSGADNPKETSPISDKKTVIIKINLDCISCVKNVCPKSGKAFMRCMKEISVDEVFESIPKEILSK